jgi:signal transduction histidine kinase/CheY-like chemotaxis protein/HAMP domain-containing protein
MRFTLRLKLIAIVAVGAISMLVLTLTGAAYEDRLERHIGSIRQSYLPKIRLQPQLENAFEAVGRTLQQAVDASDPDLLAGAEKERQALLQTISGAYEAITAGQIAAVRLAVDDYFTSALAISRKLISGETGEGVVAAVQEMQDKRSRAASLIHQVTLFDERELTKAFTATLEVQQSAARVRMIVSVSCLVALLVLSIMISRGLFRSLENLIAGFRRFGDGDFAVPIPSTSRDELGDVAIKANQMAQHLQRLDDERTHSSWVKAGQAGLGDEIRGELAPEEVATKTVAFLAKYLDAPVGALYHGPPGGPFTLLGKHAISGSIPTEVSLGDGLLGEAVRTSAITVVGGEGAGALQLRSATADTPARGLVLVPLVHADKITGILELASLRPWTEQHTELLMLVRESATVALEVARARAAARSLLAETQRQATELEEAHSHLEVKADELAKASAYKSQFLASMSHELRTPLNAIIGFSELMYDGSVPVDSAMSKEFLGDILTSGRHLLQLINDVLDLSKVEAGKLEFFPERVKLANVLSEVLGILRTTAAKQRIKLETQIDDAVTEVTLDPARLKQVLYNYISNALKFTPPGGTVTVRAKPVGEMVKIEVEDTGIGINSDDLALLFADFQQTKEGSRKAGSTGLGLSLTKRIVEAQGGNVGATSVVGTGSIFTASLPRTLAALVTAAGKPTGAVSREHSPTVLVIEDDLNDRTALVTALTSAGYTVEAVSTGSDAVARCNMRSYDAITLDLLLPDMTGLEVLQRLRDGKNGAVPVIVLTVVAERGAVAGFEVHDILLKPMDDKALLSSLVRAGVAPDGGIPVMVVDDDLASLKVMSATLSQLGYAPLCEQDPSAALARALAITGPTPAAIVLDLIMPTMSGFEFLDQLRRDPKGRAVPVIVWTSKDLTTGELAMLRSAANAVVSKGHEGNARVVAELAAVLDRRAAEEDR